MKNTVLLEKYKFYHRPKTRNSREKEYFTYEIVFYSGNLSFSGFFSSGNDRFVKKIQVLTAKTKFSRGKKYFTPVIVFYSGNIIFSREKLVEIRFFSSEKYRFVRKIQFLTAKTRFSRGKEYFTFEIVFYSGNLS